MTTVKTMAEVILRSTLLDLKDSLFLAKELTAAGFGLVADAKAEALEEAADVREVDPVVGIEMFKLDWRHRRWLRTRAAEMRQE